MKSMDKYITEFTEQIKRAVAIGESANLKSVRVPVRNVLLCGLGGSGIGGSIVSDLYKDEIEVPIVINKSYLIPAFVNENTLVIITSYSGNTEETLSALMHAHKRGAHIVCVTSGGLVKEYAELHDIDFIEIDGGMPPRACLALSLIQLMYILNDLGLIDNGFKQSMSKITKLLDESEDEIKACAKEIASKLHGTVPIIYSASSFEGVAIRFRQQLNENAKMLCWHHVIPEMSHNELVGWRKTPDNVSVIFLRNSCDFERNQMRMDYIKSVISNYTNTIIELYSKGESCLERSFYLIHVGDWVSYYLSEMNEVDAIEVNVITSLKDKLAEKPLP